MEVEEILEEVWHYALRSNPRTAQLALTDSSFAYDLAVTQHVLIEVAEGMKRRGHGPWLVKQMLHDAVYNLISDTQLDRVEAIKTLAKMPFPAMVRPFPSVQPMSPTEAIREIGP